MRISDWSSDVCSSDLRHTGYRETFHPVGPFREQALDVGGGHVAFNDVLIRDHGMTRTKVIGDVVLRLYRRHVGVIDRGDVMSVALPHVRGPGFAASAAGIAIHGRSEEHTSELQSLMRISYAVFCLKKKKRINTN